MHQIFAVFLIVGMTGCSEVLPLQHFAGTGPDFDPITFWTGHTHSRGVLENRVGEPTDLVQTDCVGETEGPDGLHMLQTITMGDGTITTRDWHMRRTGPGHFEAIVNDVVGTAVGQAIGPAFHWSWVLALKPGNPLYDMKMVQWMYLMDDGSMVNHTTVRKAGVILAQVVQQFKRRVP